MLGGIVPEDDELVPEPDEDRLMGLSSDDDSRRLQSNYYINWVEKGKVTPVKN